MDKHKNNGNYGSPILTVDENTEIFDAVHHFITGSRRFT
jgi:hypothetical protein